MEKADIGMVGLGVMGSNLALNIAEKGYTVAVYDRDEPVLKAFIEKLARCVTRSSLAPLLKNWLTISASHVQLSSSSRLAHQLTLKQPASRLILSRATS